MFTFHIIILCFLLLLFLNKLKYFVSQLNIEVSLIISEMRSVVVLRMACAFFIYGDGPFEKLFFILFQSSTNHIGVNAYKQPNYSR